ncbi:MAG: hypothetical protein A2176_05410 [Spirochaetes bacterium RBG_13_51_14]|nr:MAG: hypothetical protein A2176_05410 [Spirochaetes bacterium RBG_13_51_14]
MFKRFSMMATLIALSMIQSQADVKQQPPDSVDWSRGVIVAYGTVRVDISEQGRPMDGDSGTVISLNRGRVAAYRKARERAIENMTRLVKGIRVDSDTMMSDLLDRSDVVQTRIVSIISGRVKILEYPIDFAISGCRAELSIGDILPAVPYTYPGDEFPARIDNPIPTDYTSLIVEARGIPVEPMILPSIFNEEGLEVYGRFYVDIRHASKFGIVAYAHNEDEAMKIRSAGGHPYYAVAVKAMKGCPVLGERDIRKIFSSGKTVESLKKCRVIFIIDKIKE